MILLYHRSWIHAVEALDVLCSMRLMLPRRLIPGILRIGEIHWVYGLAEKFFVILIRTPLRCLIFALLCPMRASIPQRSCRHWNELVSVCALRDLNVRFWICLQIGALCMKNLIALSFSGSWNHHHHRTGCVYVCMVKQWAGVIICGVVYDL